MPIAFPTDASTAIQMDPLTTEEMFERLCREVVDLTGIQPVIESGSKAQWFKGTDRIAYLRTYTRKAVLEIFRSSGLALAKVLWMEDVESSSRYEQWHIPQTGIIWGTKLPDGVTREKLLDPATQAEAQAVLLEKYNEHQAEEARQQTIRRNQNCKGAIIKNIIELLGNLPAEEVKEMLPTLFDEALIHSVNRS